MCFFFLLKAGFSLFLASRKNVVHISSSHLFNGNWPESCCPFHLQIYTCGALQNLHKSNNMFHAKLLPWMMVRCSHSRPEQKCQARRLNSTKETCTLNCKFSLSNFTSARRTVRSQSPVPIIPPVSHHPCSIRWVTVESVINTRPDHMFPALLGCCDDTSRGEG